MGKCYLNLTETLSDSDTLTLKTSLRHLYMLENGSIIVLNTFTKPYEDKLKTSSTLCGNIIWTQSDCNYTLFKHNLKNLFSSMFSELS